MADIIDFKTIKERIPQKKATQSPIFERTGGFKAVLTSDRVELIAIITDDDRDIYIDDPKAIHEILEFIKLKKITILETTYLD